MSQKLFIGVFLGLGQSQDGEWFGVRPLIESFARDGVTIRAAEWNDMAQIADIAAGIEPDARTILIGHSHGGHRAIEFAFGHFGPCPVLDYLIALDPKPPLFEHMLEWVNPTYRYPAPTENAKHIIDFFGGFGCSFVEGAGISNVRIVGEFSAHDKIPIAPEVTDYLSAAIESLLQE